VPQTSSAHGLFSIRDVARAFFFFGTRSDLVVRHGSCVLVFCGIRSGLEARRVPFHFLRHLVWSIGKERSVALCLLRHSVWSSGDA
jgi:hypothetical protein